MIRKNCQKRWFLQLETVGTKTSIYSLGRLMAISPEGVRRGGSNGYTTGYDKKRNEKPKNSYIILFYVDLTSPGKKQMCLRSICLPNVICSSVRRMCRVSTMSHSRARGWLRRALSLRGIWALMCWNLISILFCSWWKVELRRPAAISFNLRHT